MNNLDSILLSYKSLIEETNQLGVLHEIADQFFDIYDNKVHELRRRDVKTFQPGQLINVNLDGKTYVVKVTKTTKSNYIHAVYVDGIHEGVRISFPPELVIRSDEDKQNG